MGSSVSQVFSNPDQDPARRLGNPKIPVNSRTTPLKRPPHHGVTVLSSMEWVSGMTKTSGSTTFGYQMDLSRFDTGFIIVVSYDWNKNEPACPENEILNSGLGMDPLYFNHTLLGVLDLSSDVTRIVFSTIGGKPYFQVQAEESKDNIPYNLIPSTVDHLPCVSISELVVPAEYISYHTDCQAVRYEGELYWFKHYETFPSDVITFHDEIIEEFYFRSQISSPFILQPTFVVTDRKSMGKFRGYLQPFQPAGSFFDLLKRLKSDQSVPDDKNLNNVWSYDFGYFSQVLWQQPAADFPRPLSGLKIDWAVKYAWAIEITSALVAMHDAYNFCGNLKLKCVILCRDGHARLINIAPWKGYNLHYAAPEVGEGTNLKLTGPRDIFGLGLMLWAIAEEIAEFNRESVADIPVLSWQEGKNSAPQWFRFVVGKCIECDPEERPSAATLYDTLVRMKSDIYRSMVLGTSSPDA